jgi:undecaprenyl-diphosphatase
MGSLDQFLFHSINGLSLPDWLETFLILARKGSTWIPLYVGIFIWLLVRFRYRGLFIALFAMACAGFTDFTNSKLLKSAFNRSRPCQTMDPDTLQLRIACGSGKSLPSSHAANHMAFSMFLYLIVHSRAQSRWVYLLFPWAVLIGFSQVFVGVHYPFDILAGFLYGLLTASVFFAMFHRIFSARMA